MAEFSGRIALVTGASRGLGFAVARELGRQGAHVIALARTAGGLEELDDLIRKDGASEGATLVPLDLRDGAALDRLGRAIYDRWGRLDLFISNAAVLGSLSPLGHITPKDFDELVAVNITANWRLIRSLDPLLKLSPAARAIFVTDKVASAPEPFWGGYGMTKAAVEALARTYAAECEGTLVKVSLFDPGPMRTALRSRAMPGEEDDTVPEPAMIAPRLMALCR